MTLWFIHLTIYSLLLIVPTISFSKQRDFNLNLPSSWTLLAEDSEGKLLINSMIANEYLYIGTMGTENLDRPKYLATTINTLATKRSDAISKIGIYRYNIETHQARPAKIKEFGNFEELTSVFSSVDGSTFRSVERQYFFQKRLYLITFTKKTANFLPLSKVQQLLSRIEPLLPKRFPLSELSETGASSSDGASTCDDCRDSQPIPSLPEKIRIPGAAADSDDSLCKDVPKNERRKPAEVSLELDATIDQCLGDSTWLNKVAQTHKAIASKELINSRGSLALPAITVFYALAKPFDHLVNAKQNIDEVKSSVGSVAAVFADNPKAYAKLLARNAYKGATQASEKYFKCYSRSTQMAKLCKLMIDVSVGTGALKLGDKLLSGAKLTSVESSAIKDLLEKENQSLVNVKALRGPEQIEKLKALARSQGLKIEDLDFDGTSIESQLARNLSGSDRFAPVVTANLDELVRSNAFQNTKTYTDKLGPNSKGYDLWWDREKVPTSASTPLKVIEPYKDLPDSMKEREVFWQKNMQAATTPGTTAQFSVDQKEGVRIAVNRIKDCPSCPMKDHSLEVMAWNKESNSYVPFVYKKIGDDWVLSKTFHGKAVTQSCQTCHGYQGTLLPLAKEYLSESGRNRKKGFGDETFNYFKESATNLLKTQPTR